MSELKIYQNGNPDYVIAESAEEAEALWHKHMGTSPDDYLDQETDFAERPDKPFTFANWLVDGEETRVRLDAADWIRMCGKGFFASVDY